MNIKEIAQLAGVSPSTVSKIVNHKDDSIAESTRERVLAVVKRHHYRPYASSISSAGPSWRLGVLLRDSVSMDTTLDGIIRTAQDHGYGTLVYNSFGDQAQERANLEAALAQRVDGIIWEPASAESLERNSGAINLPELTIGPLGDDEFTMLPYEQAAYNLTKELIDRGHRRIACLLSPGRRRDSFLTGFKRCLFDHNLPFQSSDIVSRPDAGLLERIDDRRFTAVVSSHYKQALELYQYARNLHYQVPEDFSILTVRNDTSEILRYPGSSEISSYTMRNADFGAYLCTRMVNAIEEGRKEAPGFTQEFHLSGDSTLGEPSDRRRRRIVVVGSINLDTYLASTNLPEAGAIVDTHGLLSIAGGKGTNQAVGVAKLGQPVSLIAAVGSDSAADLIYESLAEHNIDTEGVRRVDGSETGKVYIFVDDQGKSMTSRVAGANALLSPEDIISKERLFDRAAYCLMQTVVPMPTIEAACRMAHKHGASTIIKPFFCSQLPDEVLHECDILVPSAAELNRLSPGRGSRASKAAQLLDRGVGSVIVTTGRNGCTLYTHDREQDFPTRQIKSVDDTGAGDAFISALASYLLDGHTLDQSIRAANQAAGLSLTHEGVIPSLADRHELERSLAR
ncbi:PfkB family carbohydrate kinase [Bifidobacterium xylocopae]|uniref:Ribokinase n=1 Tax=Bifidobacterium xylocopae TaxID=2493119 RepID=A0A366KE46_9BIFI|nr:PfkB family carbohydrate kinase [Bifidobacterium xylocopae]RBP98941.1 ribokinase [Bifidobacterium xylocopae]